jgi:hypothetical protein
MTPDRLVGNPTIKGLIAGLFACVVWGESAALGAEPREIRRKIVADVVAIDQPYFYNRLGAYAPDGMIYALERDVIPTDSNSTSLAPGKVRLRPDKRPRPLVLRVNVGDLLEVHFTNLLQATSPSPNGATTRYSGLSVFGMELVDEVDKDHKSTEPGNAHSGSFIGRNPTSLVPPASNGVGPGQKKTYRFYAAAEGTYLIAPYADTTGAQSTSGLIGAVNVQPESAEYYRSQVTREDLRAATYKVVWQPDNRPAIPGEEFLSLSHLKTDAERSFDDNPEARIASQRLAPIRGAPVPRPWTLEQVDPSRRTTLTAPVQITPDDRVLGETGHPLINYFAHYPDGHPYKGLPVLSMIEPVHGKDPRFSIAAGTIPRVTRDLEAGIISKELRAQFSANGAPLSESEEVTHQDGAAWLITDRGGVVYLVEQPDLRSDKLDVYDATLTLVHSDLTAVITGPNAGRFRTTDLSPSFRENPVYPDRRQPYREYTILYHEASPAAQQAFPQFTSNNLSATLSPATDGFAINYGIAGISAEVLANRIGVGPMGGKDAVDLKFEEFFLSSWSVGDPAMIVDPPANSFLSPSKPAMGAVAPHAASASAPAPEPPSQVANRPARYGPVPESMVRDVPPLRPRSRYPDDPSNVYHSYMRDHLKFRVLHAGMNSGGGHAHVHHLHAHQWLRTPNSDDSAYLDSQLIIPGSAYTMEIAYGGSGNRNLTVGDSIFHCHFYPHFASGMWSLWRVHDTFEAGTELDGDGYPTPDSRALPDGELENGSPIPAVVPLPTLGMAPLPARVHLIDGGRRVYVEPASAPDGHFLVRDGGPVYDRSPGYPFFIPGYAGHRAPHPPLDFAWKEDPNRPDRALLDAEGRKQYLDGGLPRHLVLGGELVRQFTTRWDFSKDFILYDSEDKTKDDRQVVAGSLKAFELPEEGTDVEKVAMAMHARRTHPTIQPNGFAGSFTLNGLPPVSGAPYAAPDVDDQGNSNKTTTRRYKAAALQMDVVLTKQGWHYPQQRFLTLWNDVRATVAGVRPPEPFFFRSSTGDTVEFWHTNLVPSYYELDDFQVRTPTDVLGQHIHLVKFDVTSSDGAGNGFNYEDGTFSPDEVRERIDAINAAGGLYGFNRLTQFFDPSKRSHPVVKPYKLWYDDILGPPPAGQNWNGAQTTIQRFDTDPLLNNIGFDRTLRTVFTHDHFSPSTHQQAGLYAGMLVEPQGSLWYLPDGTRMNTRDDGGPTSWNGYIVPPDRAESYREFAIEFQDTALAYLGASEMTPVLPRAAVFSMVAATIQHLLPKTGSAPVPDQVRKLFLGAGIPLGKDAQVAVTTSDQEWRLTNDLVPDPKYPTEVQVYKITTTQPPGATTSSTPLLYVHTEAMNPGWADHPNGLNTQTDGNNTQNGPPYPQIISGGRQGIMTMNYRSEPVPLRLSTGTQTGQATDPAFAYSSTVTRNVPELNVQPTSFDLDPALEGQLKEGAVSADVRTAFESAGDVDLDASAKIDIVSTDEEWTITNPSKVTTTFYSIRKLTLSPAGKPRLVVFTRVPGIDAKKPGRIFPPPIVPLSVDASRDGNDGGVTPGDPFTPLLRAYANDKVQVRTLVGAHLVPHAFQISGIKWLTEPTDPLSGHRNAQAMGISEHFEMLFTLPPTTSSKTANHAFADYWYSPSSDSAGLANGLWGLMRAYDQEVGTGTPNHLVPLPSNPSAGTSKVTLDFAKMYDEAKKAGRPTSEFWVSAITASQCLPGGNLVYNSRAKINDPNAILFVRSGDLTVDASAKTVKLKSGVPMEPLILRVRAGDWIKLTIRNAVDPNSSVFKQAYTISYAGATQLNKVNFSASTNVGLHPSMVAYDVRQADGMNIGYNGPETIAAATPVTPNEQIVYWYAGNLELRRTAGGGQEVRPIPIEFGGVNLVPADPVIQHMTGLYAGLIVEPEGSRWVEDGGTRASAVVTKADGSVFREFVVVWQNDLQNFQLVAPGSPRGAVNYRTEPFGVRNLQNPVSPGGFEAAFSNSIINPTDPSQGDPVTPTFVAPSKMPTRFHMLFPGGIVDFRRANPPAFVVLQAHNWQEKPYVAQGRRIGDNPVSQHTGAQEHSAYEAFTIVLPRAGGSLGVAGDYLYHSYTMEQQNGSWGLFRVQSGGAFIARAFVDSLNNLTAEGAITRNDDGTYAANVAISKVDNTGNKTVLKQVPIDPTSGTWRLDPGQGVAVPEGTVIVAEPSPSSKTGLVTTPVVVPRKVD